MIKVWLPKDLSLNGVLTSMIKYCLDQLRYSTYTLLSWMRLLWLPLKLISQENCLRYYVGVLLNNDDMIIWL